MTNPTLARALLEERLAGRSDVTLVDAERLLLNAGFRRSGNEISRILRSMDFARVGWSGCGYDRTPLYRRPA